MVLQVRVRVRRLLRQRRVAELREVEEEVKHLELDPAAVLGGEGGGWKMG